MVIVEVTGLGKMRKKKAYLMKSRLYSNQKNELFIY